MLALALLLALRLLLLLLLHLPLHVLLCWACCELPHRCRCCYCCFPRGRMAGRLDGTECGPSSGGCCMAGLSNRRRWHRCSCW